MCVYMTLYRSCVLSFSTFVMPVCEICSEELACDSELKTHLLLTHLEDEVSCPLCSLSGVSYDELNFHINTAHAETDSGHTDATVEPRHPKRKSETGAGISSVSRSPETQNGVMKPNHRHAGETSDPGKKHEKTRGSNMMELLASKQRRLSSPSKGDIQIRLQCLNKTPVYLQFVHVFFVLYLVCYRQNILLSTV